MHGNNAAISGRALGGRRARVTLVALAVADGVVPADRLAQIVWGDDLPPTWAVALRGVVRGVRAVCAPLGGDDQRLIATMPTGYRLAEGVDVDVAKAEDDLVRAAELLDEGRFDAVVELTEPITRLSGDQVLPGEDGEWLEASRRALDATALRARELLIGACSQRGDHYRAIETARRALDRHPLEEGLHRSLITALARSGDRAGAAQAYERCRELLADQLGVDPSTETADAYLAALRGTSVSAIAPMPLATTSFVGRESELALLARALGRPGLVTVTGRGGVGKSRLAARAAAASTAFAGGRLWIPLAPVVDDELVATTVALGLGVPFGTDDAATAVADHLAPLGRALLILDGCERVVDGVASLVALLLARVPTVTVLATSRVQLALDGEHVVAVNPLPPPDHTDDLAGNGQVRLLVDRVREAGGTLDLDATIAPHVVALCRRCGGLPLALELAAAQLAAMSAADFVDHLDSFEPTPESSLRAIARTSYLDLDEDEAAVFRGLAVLDGLVALPLIRQVVAHGPVTPIRVVRILRELTARGLLVVDRSGAHWRYQHDDDLHRFAGELLAERGEERLVFRRLADAIRSRLPVDARAAPGPFRQEISSILGSIRSLFAAGIAGRASIEDCQELGFRLHRYFATTSLHEGRFWLDRLSAANPSGTWAPYATYALGYLSYWAGDTDRATRELRSAVAVLDGSRDSYRARGLIFLAGLLDDIDDGAGAVEHVRLSIEAAASHDVDLQCSAAMGMGSVLAERVDADAAGFAHDAIALCRTGGSPDQLAIALPTAAMICWQVGDLESARAYVAEGLPLNVGPARIARVVLLSAAAGVALADGDLAAAIEHGETANREATELGVEREVPLIRAVLARTMVARGEVAAAAEYAAGALRAAEAMTIEVPFAIGLETATLVLDAAGDGTDAAEFLASARAIRARGDRPPPATLSSAVDDLRRRVGEPSSTPAPRDAAERARERLTHLADAGHLARSP